MFGFKDNLEKAVRFQKQTREKYTMRLSAEMHIGGMAIKTVSECRWELQIEEISESTYEIELLTLDNVMLEANHPNLKEISAFNNAFKKMYNELELVIDKQGRLLAINNLSHIRSKWIQVKNEMEQIQNQNESIKGIIQLNDELFSSKEKIELAVKSNEFFDVYFHCFYGKELPKKVKIKKRSLFQQADIDWEFDIKPDPYLPTNQEYYTINLKGENDNYFEKDWLKQAYGHFSMIPAEELSPKMYENGKYIIKNATGMIQQSKLEKEEIAHPLYLRSKMTYELTADSYLPFRKTL